MSVIRNTSVIEFTDIDDEQFNAMIDNTITDFDEGDLVMGIVVKIEHDEVLLDIGFKSEGVIPSRELTIRKDADPSEIVSVNEKVEALVLQKEDKDGRLVLSRKRAEYERAWIDIEKKFNTAENVIGEVIEVVKGGLILDIGLRGFLPASLVDLRRVRDLDSFNGEKIEARVIEMDRNRNNVVLSRRVVLEEGRKNERSEILEKLTKGMRLKGSVSSIVEFGAFVDLGGIDGLVHISELSWNHVSHPSEVVKVGDEVDVEVLEVDLSRERISLGLKQTTEDPWHQLRKNYPVGAILEGKVTKLLSFGCFVELGDNIEGLVHISEMANRHVIAPAQVVRVGDMVHVKVIDIDQERRRISLSMKAAAETLGIEILVAEPDPAMLRLKEAKERSKGDKDVAAKEAGVVEAAAAEAEIADVVEVTEVADETDVVEADEAVAAVEAAAAEAEVIEVAEVADETDVVEADILVETVEVVEAVEAVEALDVAVEAVEQELVETVETVKVETVEAVEIVEAPETFEAPEAAEAIEITAEVLEEVAEAPEPAATTEVAEAPETLKAVEPVEAAEKPIEVPVKKPSTRKTPVKKAAAPKVEPTEAMPAEATPAVPTPVEEAVPAEATPVAEIAAEPTPIEEVVPVAPAPAEEAVEAPAKKPSTRKTPAKKAPVEKAEPAEVVPVAPAPIEEAIPAEVLPAEKAVSTGAAPVVKKPAVKKAAAPKAAPVQVAPTEEAISTEATPPAEAPTELAPAEEPVKAEPEKKTPVRKPRASAKKDATETDARDANDAADAKDVNNAKDANDAKGA